MSDNQKIIEAITYLKTQIKDQKVGLPQELFEFVTEITPMVNVDLLVKDEQGRILLSWRDDEFCGQGWHVPGGIVRWRESLETRILRTAWREFGSEVEYLPEPVEIRELINEDHTVRSHFIAFTYECRLKDASVVDKQMTRPQNEGYLAWHRSFPENMIDVHRYYRKYFKDGEIL